MVVAEGDYYVVGGDEFTVGLGRLLQMWVAIWWQWVCGCFDSLSQIGCKFWFSFEFLLWVSVHLQVHGGGSGGCCGGGRDGSLWVYSGDGFIVMEVAIVWVRFRWHLGLWAFGLDFSGVCIIFVGIWVVIGWLNVAEFWWKVLCVFARERDKKVKRNERWKSRKRN